MKKVCLGRGSYDGELGASCMLNIYFTRRNYGMNYKKLKICKPQVFGFGHQCAVYSILSAYPEIEAWLNCNYIQIFTLRNLYTAKRRLGTLDFFYQYYGDFNLYEMKANPWFNFMSIPFGLVQDKWSSVLEFVKERIDNEQYLYMVLNRTIYRGGNSAFYHNVLIWGYDNVEQKIYVADNNSIGKFSFEEISYSDFEVAADVPETEYGIGDHGSRPDGIYFFSVVASKDKHISGTNHMMQIGKLQYDLSQYIIPPKILPDYSYGVDCYEELKKYYYDIEKNKYEDCDIRSICSLLDHKVLMTKRLNYLFVNGYMMTNYENEYRNHVEKKCLALRNMLLKELIKQDIDFLADKLCVLLDEIKEEEIYILSKVSLELKDYLDAHECEYVRYS